MIERGAYGVSGSQTIPVLNPACFVVRAADRASPALMPSCTDDLADADRPAEVTGGGRHRSRAADMQSLRFPQFLLTRMRCENGPCEIAVPEPRQRGFIISMQLREQLDHRVWLRGRLAHAGRFPAGGASVLDLEDEPSFGFSCAFDSLHFLVGRATLDALAEQQGARRIETLSWPHGRCDGTLSHLVAALLPALEDPQSAGKLFLDHMGRALIAHFACAYGQMRVGTRCAQGGLAPWQERRCKELMLARIAEQISLDDLAKECRLSNRHFARAFRRTTGEPPHRWLLLQRVDAAKEMLLDSERSLPEIAIACGFADQSHLTRVFSGMIGVPPGAWRRSRQG